MLRGRTSRSALIPVAAVLLACAFGAPVAIADSSRPESGERQILQKVSNIIATKSDEKRADLAVEFAAFIRAQDRLAIERPAVIEAVASLLDDKVQSVTYDAAFILAHIGPPARIALPSLRRELKRLEAWEHLRPGAELGFKFNEDQQPEYAVRYAIAKIERQSLDAFDSCRPERDCTRGDAVGRTYSVILVLRNAP